MATKTVAKKEVVKKEVVVSEIRPYITEKAGLLAEKSNAYTFEIGPKSTKKTVAKAVKAQYNFTPVKVNIAKTPSKKTVARGKIGYRGGHQKAIVFLKKGDKIEFV